MFDTLTIADLEALIAEAKHNGAEDDTPVHFSYNYGDHWRTTVAPGASCAELGNVEHSTYHGMDKLVEESDEDCDDSESNGTQVFIIS